MLFKAATEKGNPIFSVVQVAKTEPRWYDKNGEPTDSYASTESGSHDLEKGSNSDDHVSPDPHWRNTSSSGPRNNTDEGDGAPAPSIRRTQSADRDARRSYDA